MKWMRKPGFVLLLALFCIFSMTNYAAADAIDDMVAQMQEIYGFMSDYDKDNISAARDELQSFATDDTDPQWDDVLNDLLTNQVILRFGDETAARAAAQDIVTGLGNVYYSTDSTQLRTTLEDFKDKYNDEFKTLFGDDITLDELYGLFFDAREALPGAFSESQAGLLATEDNQYLLEKMPNYLVAAMDDALSLPENLTFSGRLSAIGWSSSMLINQQEALAEIVDTAGNARISLALAAVRSETVLEAGPTTLQVGSSTDVDEYTIKIMGRYATDLVAWASADSSVVDIGEDPDTGNFVIEAIAPGETELIVYRDYDGADPDYDWLYKFTVTVEGSGPPSSEKAILGVLKVEDFSSGSAVELQHYNDSTDFVTHKVTITLPYGSVLTDLAPYFDLSIGATIDPVNGTRLDFTNPQTYTVTAEDGSTQDWSVTIQVGESEVTTIQVITGHDDVVKHVDNSTDAERVFVANGTTVSQLLAGIEATDGSPQEYTVTRNGTVQAGDTVLAAGDILEVQADNPNPAFSASYDIKIALFINGGSLNAATRGMPYEWQLAMATGGGVGTITWEIDAGSTVPPGLALNEATGALTGTPTAAGDYSFTVIARDNQAPAPVSTATADYTLKVYEPALLIDLTISQGTLTPTFDPETFDYTASVANSVKSVTIETVSNVGLTASGTGTFDLVVGANTFEIDVTGAGYGATTYTIVITRKSSSGGGGGGGLSGFAIRTSGTTAEMYNMVVDIPEGAVDEDTRGDIERLDNDEINAPEDSVILGYIYEFSKEAPGNFLEPVNIKLPYDKGAVDIDKYTLSIYRFDEDADEWVELENVEVKTYSINGETFKTGYFAVIATEKSVEPPVEPPVEPDPVLLTDISGHWAENAIQSLVGMDAIAGYPDKTFRPDNTITRAEFATVLVKAFDLPDGQGKVFNDTTTHWAKDYISAAYAAGIIQGYDDTRFGPDDLITREQMAIMIVKAAKLQQASGQLSFADSGKVSVWAYSWVMSAVNNQLMSGYEDNTFRPQNNATRAEAVTVIYNALN